MASQPAKTGTETFHTGEILTLSLCHFIHDVYSGFLAPLLPLLIDKLSEILFIHVIRSHVERCNDQGFIAALADIQIGKALSEIHGDPARQWSVERLAKTAGMSRSAFAERFSRLVEMTPMQYLTRWRMAQAKLRFQTTDHSVAQVAASCGYQSEAAFAKAFKKQFGYGPGHARKNKKSTYY